jgi:hypothetical protein
MSPRTGTELGYIFLSPTNALEGHGAPTIYTDDGELGAVWSALQGPDMARFISSTGSQKIHRITLPDGNRNFQTALVCAFHSYIDIREDVVTDQGTSWSRHSVQPVQIRPALAGHAMAGFMTASSTRLTSRATTSSSAGAHWITPM